MGTATTTAVVAQLSSDHGPARQPVRRSLGLLLLAASLLVCGGPEAPQEDAASLTRAVRTFVEASQGTTGGAYRRPPPSAAQDLTEAVTLVAAGRPAPAAE